MKVIRDRVLNGEARKSPQDQKGIPGIEGYTCIPRVRDLIWLIIEESHCSRYSFHLWNFFDLVLELLASEV